MAKSRIDCLANGTRLTARPLGVRHLSRFRAPGAFISYAVGAVTHRGSALARFGRCAVRPSRPSASALSQAVPPSALPKNAESRRDVRPSRPSRRHRDQGAAATNPAPRCSRLSTPKSAAPTSISITASSKFRSRSSPATSPSASSTRHAEISRTSTASRSRRATPSPSSTSTRRATIAGTVSSRGSRPSVRIEKCTAFRTARTKACSADGPKRSG